MRAHELVGVIKKFKEDPEYHEIRRGFHETYEWIEGYWRQCPGIRNLDKFCKRFGDYYWNLKELRRLAWELASQGCVGNSRNRYKPTQEVIKATMFLLHRAEIKHSTDEVPGCHTMDCYKTRKGLELCNAQQQADEWTHSEFKATMYTVCQIRNNLFHGRKLELEPRQYERNRRLITIAEKITALLINHLVEAELWYNSATHRQHP